MLKFIKTPTGMVVTGIIVVAVILIIANWTTVKGWFMPADGGRFMAPGTSERQMCKESGGEYYYDGFQTTYAACKAHGAI